MRSRGGGGGGHATAAGVQFQVNVAADLVVGMLAERDYEPPWRWPRETTIESVRVETSEPTDDISASTSLGGRAYIQAKNSLDLGTAATSEFGKAVTQLANQYVVCRDGDDGRTLLDPDNDRLVLAVGKGASGTIRESLRGVLDRVRDWPADKPLLDAASGEQQRKALETTVTHINAAVAARDGYDPDDAELRRILYLITVSVHDFAGDDGAAQRAALQLLRGSVVADTNRTGDAWHAICAAVTSNAAGQSGLDRHRAQEVLRRESIAVVAPPSYREDIVTLRALLAVHLTRTLAELAVDPTVQISASDDELECPYDWYNEIGYMDTSELVPTTRVLYQENAMFPDLDEQYYDQLRRIRIPTVPFAVSPRGFVKVAPQDDFWLDPRKRDRRIYQTSLRDPIDLSRSCIVDILPPDLDTGGP